MGSEAAPEKGRRAAPLPEPGAWAPAAPGDAAPPKHRSSRRARSPPPPPPFEVFIEIGADSHAAARCNVDASHVLNGVSLTVTFF